MRILYVSQYFPPEMGAPAARVYELSRHWASLGHQVTVLTAFAHHPTGIKAKEDRGVLTRREEVDGIDVIRTYVYAAPNQGSLKRMLSYASFMGSASTIGRVRAPRCDVVVASSPQLLCGAAGYWLAATKRRPFVFEVRDLWPESMVAVGAASERNLVYRGLKRLSRFLYKHCKRIVTVGEGYAESIAELYGVDKAKISIVHNGVDTSLFIPGPRENDVRREFGWGDRFVLLYIGTHGMAHALESVLETAELFRDDPDKLFAFVGEGAEKAKLKQIAAERNLTNVQFIDGQPKERVPGFYAACDAGIVSLRDTPRFQEVLPSKIFEYLGMERPILLTVRGEAKRLVEQADAGLCVEPENPQALAEAVRRISADPDRCLAMGQSGRRYVLEHYDRRRLAEKYLDVLADVVGDGGKSPKTGNKAEKKRTTTKGIEFTNN